MDGGDFEYVGQTAGPNIVMYVDTSLQPLTTYSYQVIAQNNGGSSAPSNVDSAMTLAAPNSSPTANGGGPYSGTVRQSITFNGGGSSDPDGDSLTYAWDFGDGNVGTGMQPTHTYSSAGSFPVNLTVDDGNGGSDSDATTATVQIPSAITLSATGYKVKGRHRADLTWNGASGASIDVHRDGSLVTTTANDGAYTDLTTNRGSRSYTYQVCEAGTSTCSNIDTVSF